ncbi:MAG: glycoside hydrolase family 3 C-terminal domain-containing protein [Nocardioides sp.]|uniref:glycoside hydrolase family 3 C-terminal domain-containing protein n=1 Tax=Nocardioides sp. TaxID=35761 RepID=UPI0039E6B77A
MEGAQSSASVSSVTSDAKVDALLAKMSLDEKLTLLTGQSVSSVGGDENQSQAGYLPGIPRLGIPSLTLADGPPGVVTKENSTGHVSEMGQAATFDTDQIEADGTVVGKDADALGQDVVLEPFINMDRDTSGDRTWNTYGEDPYLTGQMGAAAIKGIQSTGTMAQAKHYIAYDGGNNVEVDEQTLHEVYLAPFADASDAGVSSMMCAYGAVNVGQNTDKKYSSCGNSEMLTTVLRDQVGFTGFVTSDWGGTHATTDINTGLDMEMPGGSYFSKTNLKAAIADGEVTMATVNQAVGRILFTYDRFGLLDHAPKHNVTGEDRVYDNKVIQQTASESATLLKNDDVLPLNDDGNVALIGPGAGQTIATYGTGEKSGGIAEEQTGTYQVLKQKIGATADLTYAVGDDLTGKTIPASALSHQDDNGNTVAGLARTTSGLDGTQVDDQVWDTVARDNALPAGSTSTWTGTLTVPEDGTYWINVGILGSASASLKIDDQSFGGSGSARYGTLHANEGNGPAPTTDNLANFRYQVTLTAGEHDLTLSNTVDESDDPVQMRLSWVTPSQQQTNHDAAVDAAASAQTAVVFAYTTQEGNLEDALPESQDQLIEDVAAVNPNTVVVLNNNQPIAMSWLDDVAGVLDMWFPGDRGGYATADVLLGNVNPGGRLPVTWAKSIDQEVSHDPDHPERSSAGVGESCPSGSGTILAPWTCPVTTYSEGVNIGYRHFAAEGETPLYSFGYGLSYTTFSYRGLKVAKTEDGGLDVSFAVKNTGKVAGDVTPQVYLGAPDGDNGDAQFAPTALAAFKRITLKAGEQQQTRIHVRPRQLQYWSSENDAWTKALGTRSVSVNSDASTAELTAKVTVNKGNLVATTAPKVTGAHRVGQTLHASSGAWDQASVKISYQWLRNGTTIKGATKATYRQTVTDFGAALSVRIIATKSGYDNGTVTTKGVRVKAATTHVTLRGERRAKAGQQIAVKVSVTATGATPTGAVTLRDGKQSVMATLKHGKATVHLRLIGVGNHRIIGSYKPGAGFAASRTTELVRVAR